MLLRENLQNIEEQKEKKIQPPVNQFSIVGASLVLYSDCFSSAGFQFSLFMIVTLAGSSMKYFILNKCFVF